MKKLLSISVLLILILCWFPYKSPGQSELHANVLKFTNDVISDQNQSAIDKESSLESTTVRGTVTDRRTGSGIPGVNVYIKVLGLGASTDVNGAYSFIVPEEKAKGVQVVLTVKVIGYKEMSRRITLEPGTITVDFALEEDIFQAEEVVVTGIASKTSKALAEIAVGRVSALDLQQINTYGGLSQLVGGKVPGVQLTTASGNVGAGWRFYVRGGGGLNGDGQPIIYVDGVRMDNQEVIGYAVGGQGISTLANLNTNDIEKIEFLKGPAAASMYGANGSNGVVLITTKTGKLVPQAGLGVSVDYRFNYGYNEKVYTYSHDNFTTDTAINRQFKKGPVRENYVGFSGGSSILRYFTSFENRNEDGIMSGTSENRNTVRLNVTSAPVENLTLKLNANYIKNHIKRPNNDNIIYGALGNTILYFTPFGYVKEQDLSKFDDDHDINQFIGSAYLSYSPINDLEINAGIGIDNTNWRQVRLFPYGVNFGGLITQGQKSIYVRFNRQYTYDFNASYKYQLFDMITVKSIIGGQFFDRTNKTTNLVGEQYTSSLITGLGAAGKIASYGEGFSNTRDGGLYTEHSFNYLEQYFLTLAIRQDYASSIGANAPSIIYPKASAAVRVDKYGFLPEFFDLFKLRTAYGESGVLPGSLDGIPLLWTAEAGGYGAGAVVSVIGNKDIQPERVKEFEVGFDTELLNSISLEFTYYLQKAKNSIVGKVNAPSTGLTASTQPFNVGAVDASGFETLIKYSPFRTTDYSLELGVIWNYQKNEVKSLGGAQPIYGNNMNVIKEGMPKFEFYNYTSIGANYDANGKYTSSIKSADRVDLGNPIPNHSGSLTIDVKFLKNFHLYGFGEWALNIKIWNYTQQFANRLGNGTEYNRMTALLGLPELAKGSAPKDVTPLTPGTDEYKKVAEDYARKDWRNNGNYVEDADYFIIREVSLSYDLTDILNEYGITKYLKGLSVGISIRNLARFTKYSGADVEFNYTGSRSIARNNDFLTLQNPRTINFWLRLGI